MYGNNVFFLCFLMFLGFIVGVGIHPSVIDYFSSKIAYAEVINSGLGGALIVVIIYSVLYGISSIFCGFFGYPKFTRFRLENNDFIATKTAMFGSSDTQLISDKQQSRSANHEAGHLIALGLFDDSPEYLKAFISTKFTSKFFGQVVYRHNEEACISKSYYIAKMKLDLAGIIAEEIVYGDFSVGNTSDMEDWERTARAMFSSFPPNEIWFYSPSNKEEVMSNATTLRDLRNSQEIDVKEYLQERKSLLQEASDLILEKKELEGDVLMEIVGRSKSWTSNQLLLDGV